jgi:hypothetical protein
MLDRYGHAAGGEEREMVRKSIVLVLCLALSSVLAPPSSAAGAGASVGKTGSISKRWFVGGWLGLGFGDVTWAQISPLIGYRLSRRASIGTSFLYRYRKDSRYEQDLSTTDYGASLFARFNIVKPFFAHAEYEVLDFEYYSADLTTDRKIYDSLFVGGGAGYGIGRNASTYVLVLYNLTYDSSEPIRPYDSPWVLRLGAGFSF